MRVIDFRWAPDYRETMRARTLLVATGWIVAVSLGACAHANDDDFGVGGAAASSTSSVGSGSTSGSMGSGSTASAGGATTSGATTSGASTSGTSTSAATSSASASASSSASSSTGARMTGLYFSEYVEGTSNNKALEIYNAGPGTADLGDCEIGRYQNGSTSPLAPLALDAVTLGAGQVYVVCHTMFAQPGLCDQVSGSVQHTGNDVAELSCGGVVLDVFGRVGEDAVWGTSPTVSMDATLRRKCTVTVGDKNASDAFDPATQWTGFPADTVADLGQYVCP